MRERSFLRIIKRNLDSSFRQPNWANNFMEGDVFTSYFFPLSPPVLLWCLSYSLTSASSWACHTFQQIHLNHQHIHTQKSQEQDSSFFPSLSFEKFMLGKLKPHKNGLTKAGASKSDTQSESPSSTAVSSWVCQSSATSSGMLGYRLGFKFNIPETMKLNFLSHLHLLRRRYKQEREEKKEKLCIKRVALGSLKMLLVPLFVLAWATTPRLRVQSSTETVLPSF